MDGKGTNKISMNQHFMQFICNAFAFSSRCRSGGGGVFAHGTGLEMFLRARVPQLKKNFLVHLRQMI